MTLVDTTIWIDHLRAPDPMLAKLLLDREVLTHPIVVAEIALGSIKDRASVLDALDNLPFTRELLNAEVRGMIERHRLWGSGIGFADAHLLGAPLLTPRTRLWTRDRRLHAAAVKLGVATASLH